MFALLAAFVSGGDSSGAAAAAAFAPSVVAQADSPRSASSRDEGPFLPEELPLHTRDELALIVRQLDGGDLTTARSHWRQLVAAERGAGRGNDIARYLQWVLAQAYRDETRAADELLEKNQFYDRLRRTLLEHERAMQQLQTQLAKGKMHVVRAVAHLPIYRAKDPPAPKPQYAPRQMDRAALTDYLQQLHRDIADLGHDAGLKTIDLPAARANRAALTQEIKQVQELLRQDASAAGSSAG